MGRARRRRVRRDDEPPRALREALADEVPFSSLALEDEAHSADGTVKALFRTADGHPVEAVLMRYRDGRRSICVSSQSGCPLTCTFCATGAMRFGRNLKASEILDQVLHFRRTEPVNHLVFMGMGEPMLNLDEVLGAARRLPEVGITHRRTTISTVGWLPGLTRFVDEVEQPIRLALSIHAADPALRSRLMPVNDRYPLADVLAECRRYFALRRRKVFVEYVMLGGVNDAPEHARELAALLDPKIFKVNLIPYNPTGMYDGSSRGRSPRSRRCSIAALPSTVRLTRGRDIAAACGQLAASGTPARRAPRVALTLLPASLRDDEAHTVALVLEGRGGVRLPPAVLAVARLGRPVRTASPRVKRSSWKMFCCVRLYRPEMSSVRVYSNVPPELPSSRNFPSGVVIVATYSSGNGNGPHMQTRKNSPEMTKPKKKGKLVNVAQKPNVSNTGGSNRVST